MISLNAEIENLKDDMDRSRTELEKMYMELGEVAFPWHQAINYAPSQEPYNALAVVAAQKDEIDGNIASLKASVSELNRGDRQIEQTKLSMKQLDKRYSVLISSLGAVAIEIDGAGNLPQRLSKCLQPMREYEARLKAGEARLKEAVDRNRRLRIAIWEKKLRKLRMQLDGVFAQTGRKIYESGNFREVPGQRAAAILDEMEHIRFAKKNYKNDILDHKNMIDEAQGNLRNLGAFGEENRKLREMQSHQARVADRLSDLYAEYGRVLAQGIPYWMDDQAPDDLKRCCTLIIMQTKRIASQNLNMSNLMMSREIEIHGLQVSQLSEQMNHLNSQIQAIENQKSDIQQRLDVELKAISELKMKQNEITKQAAQYE